MRCVDWACADSAAKDYLGWRELVRVCVCVCWLQLQGKTSDSDIKNWVSCLSSLRRVVATNVCDFLYPAAEPLTQMKLAVWHNDILNSCVCVRFGKGDGPTQELMFQTSMSSFANICVTKEQDSLTYVILIYLVSVFDCFHYTVPQYPKDFRYSLSVLFCLFPIVKKALKAKNHATTGSFIKDT